MDQNHLTTLWKSRINSILLFVICVRNILLLNNNNVFIKSMYLFELTILFVYMLIVIWWGLVDKIKTKQWQLYGLLFVISFIDFIVLINEQFNYMNIAYFIQTIHVSMFIGLMETSLNTVIITTSILIYYIFMIIHFFIKNNIDLEIFFMCSTIIICIFSLVIYGHFNKTIDEDETINLTKTNINDSNPVTF